MEWISSDKSKTSSCGGHQILVTLSGVSLKCFGCSWISQDRSNSHPSLCRLRCYWKNNSIGFYKVVERGNRNRNRKECRLEVNNGCTRMRNKDRILYSTKDKLKWCMTIRLWWGNILSLGYIVWLRNETKLWSSRSDVSARSLPKLK